MAGAMAISVAACGAQEAPASDASGEAEGAVGAEEPLGDAARSSYTVRLDSESSDPSLYRIVEDDDGIRVETGPAGIAYRDDDVVRAGDFLAEATFVLYGAPLGYREAYGIFVGGLDLEEPDQEYTYLLIRSTGDFLVKRRIGEVTETIIDWTPHDAVARVAADGDAPSNTLAVEVVGPETRFVVNGVAVHTAPTTRVRPHGIAGVRVNHRLDVRVDDWTLDQRTGS
jgi:hypothetical protein